MGKSGFGISDSELKEFVYIGQNVYYVSLTGKKIFCVVKDKLPNLVRVQDIKTGNYYTMSYYEIYEQKHDPSFSIKEEDVNNGFMDSSGFTGI